MLSAGENAPEFSLKDQNENEVTLESLKGKKSLIIFVPFAFSGVCTGEICELEANTSQLQELDANVVVVSVDSAFSNAAWAKEQGVNIPVLADFWPHGEVAKAFGNFNQELGCANRTAFVLDKDGVVAKAIPSADIGSARSFTEYTEALSAI